MRREYNKIVGYIPPFLDDLVFWAPLTEGDITDNISGNRPTTSAGCSYTWNDNKKMYMLYANGNSTSRYSALLYSGLSMNLTDGQDLTFVVDCEEISGMGNGYNIMLGIPATTSRITAIAYLNHYRYTSQANYTNLLKFGRYACVYSGTTCKFYKDGILTNTAVSASWRGIKFTENTASICQLNSNNYSYSMFAKNARIYRRALTDNEVAQL